MSTPPGPLESFLDDAAVLPPRGLSLDAAVAEHRAHRASEYAGLVGAFVVTDGRIPDLLEILEGAQEGAQEPLGVRVVVTGGAGAIEGAVRWAVRSPALDLQAIQFALRDEDDLAHNARRVVAMLDSLAAELDDADVLIEPPRLHGAPTSGWLAALDELAARELMLAVRTGRSDTFDVPADADVAACIEAALDRELAFASVGGTGRAVRDGTDHGFLNVLAATVLSLEGNDVEAALSETSADALAEIAREEGARGRRWFRSTACGDVLEAHEDLVDLGLA